MSFSVEVLTFLINKVKLTRMIKSYDNITQILLMGVNFMKKIFWAITVAIVLAFSSTTIWAEDRAYNVPEFSSESIVGNDGLTDKTLYRFGDNELETNPTDILLMVNGEFVPYKGVLEKNTTFVPVRVISEAFGKSVNWNGTTKQVKIDDILLTIGSKTATVKGGTVTLPYAPFIDNGLTYVPIRFIAENLNKEVGFIKRGNEVLKQTNAIVWVEDKNLMNNGGKTEEEMTTFVKAHLLSIDELFRAEGNIEPFTKESVENMSYYGQIGRYAIYNCTRPIIVDMKNKSVYDYLKGHEYSLIYQLTK